ncbi:isochorismatase [Enterococcus faecium]|nr:isochorismatase [Enterococcus faecium]
MSNTADAIVVIDLQKGVCFDSSPIHELETVTALVNKRIKTYETIGKASYFRSTRRCSISAANKTMGAIVGIIYS